MHKRKTVLADNETYHVFNRSIGRQSIFTNIKECNRAIIALKYYRFLSPPLKLSRALILEKQKKIDFFENLEKNSEKLVDIFSYCLMPSHFHILLRQKLDNGISRFLGNFTNSYAQYVNTKHKRAGPVFEGAFKAVHIETEEQLIHVSRYIHINPVVSLIISEKELDQYPWSSFSEYLGKDPEGICDKSLIMEPFPSIDEYRQFVYDQIGYGKRLELIKHLILEED